MPRMSSVLNVPCRSGWPHGVRGACQFGSLAFAAVVSAGTERIADGVRPRPPPRPPPPPPPPRAPRPPPPCPCTAGPAAGAGLFCAARGIIVATRAALATHVVMNRFIYED